MRSQNSLEEEEEAILLQQQTMLAKLARLRKQKRLLQKRAGDFIARDYKEIAELEDLERREAEEISRIEKERAANSVAGQSHSASKRSVGDCSASSGSHAALSSGECNQTLAATSEDPTLTQMIAMADPSSAAFWDGVDFDASFASVLRESSSPRGSTVEPAGGSPSSGQ